MSADSKREERGLGAVGNALRRRPCRIAYLGASVTAQRQGYVGAFHSRLQQETGQDHSAIVAAIGGVGSISGAFLMDGLLKGRSPDLCFVEFTTTDLVGYTPLPLVGPAIEGITRKLMRMDAQPVFLHLPRIGIDPTIGAPVLAAYARVAEHYGIPVLDIAARWNKETTLTQTGRIRDNVHLTEAGARDCAEHIWEALRDIASGPGVDTNAAHQQPVHERAYDATELAMARPFMLEAPERATERVFRFNYPVLDVAPRNGVRFSNARGITGALVVVGPRAGTIEVRTPGGLARHSLFDEYCHYERLNTVIFTSDQNEPEAVELRLADDVVDTSVCRRPVALTAPSERRLSLIAFLSRR